MSHGHRRHPDYGGGASPTYTSWRCMINRCTNPRHRSYEEYGGSGVVIHPSWMKFENFLRDMGERPSTNHPLGRTTPFSDYGPGECEWQTKAEQNKGLRDQSKDLIEIGGVAKTRDEWARDLGIKYKTLQRRKQRKWGDAAYTTPPGSRRPDLNIVRFREPETDDGTS